jgi:hypothetical protein
MFRPADNVPLTIKNSNTITKAAHPISIFSQTEKDLQKRLLVKFLGLTKSPPSHALDVSLYSATLIALFAAAFLGPSHANAGLALSAAKKDKIYDFPAVVTLKTDVNPQDINDRQIGIVADTLLSSCSKAHKDELSMIDSVVDSVNRKHQSADLLTGDIKNPKTNALRAATIGDWEGTWDYSYVYKLLRITCLYCDPDDEDNDFFPSMEVLMKGKKKGHLKQWEKALCSYYQWCDHNTMLTFAVTVMPWTRHWWESTGVSSLSSL